MPAALSCQVQLDIAVVEWHRGSLGSSAGWPGLVWFSLATYKTALEAGEKAGAGWRRHCFLCRHHRATRGTSPSTPQASVSPFRRSGLRFARKS